MAHKRVKIIQLILSPFWAALIHFPVRTSFVVEVSEMMFVPPPARSQYSILVLVWGCWRPMCTHCGAFRGLLGAVRRHIVELEGPRGPFGTGKSSCMCRATTISLHLAIFSMVLGGFGQKRAHFGPKLQILKWRFSTCDAPPRPPPMISYVVVPHTHR